MFSVPLETKRFIIRQFEPKDVDDFLAFMLDDDSTKYLAFEDEQTTSDGAKALFDFVCSSYKSENPVHSYVIAEKDTDRYLGSCGFAPYDEGVYECYYSVNTAARGKGVATEATKAMVQLLTEDAEVRAYCHPENHASRAVATKVGFTYKGTHLHKHSGLKGALFVYPKA
ncbi:MAG: N-acetyltransferase [Chloroflexi bacterium AL-W]|nr:N-acetyltransferase [Chloroflexi bacterium AL-N1]NOK68277.1 N-acetyltransferase [Chloroflexi bacterium AL-N10]NOK73923.1 N-acetyltransferase [Chloroflexi bacterium AL-N5]NOK82891.1 N-acetyltransferase [Chloroflexi bacterium AL-W]NOK90413.1 N-acetyltransferase [Chloroflexi bacterium AL-N15]